MSPNHPIFALIVFAIAFGTAFLLRKKFPLTTTGSRYETIDGLRGFLAFAVFLHHAYIWFKFIHTNAWQSPESAFYNQLGQTGVAFFFMITSFLFVTKLLQSDEKPIRWDQLFVSRLFRLAPMYFVSIILLVFVVMILSQWHRQVSFSRLMGELACWVTFTIPAAPNINGSVLTSIVNAGVVWSLPYEWLFYFSLPILAVLISRKLTAIPYLVLSIGFVSAFCYYKGIGWPHVYSFLGGAIAPFIIKFAPPKFNINHPGFNVVILLCVLGIPFFWTADNLWCKLLIAIVFNLISLGNDFMGILKSKTLKFLGEISYSTYLMHGIVLFLVQYFLLKGCCQPMQLIPYWISIFCTTPLVVFVSLICFKYVEKPAMEVSKKVLRVK